MKAGKLFATMSRTRKKNLQCSLCRNTEFDYSGGAMEQALHLGIQNKWVRDSSTTESRNM